MNNLAVKGELTVCGITVPNINGGFGLNKKAMLATHISDIHKRELKKVNELINENKKYFKDSIDIIDIKQVGQTDLFLESGILSKAQIGNAKNIYLLSERGYAKLIKIFDDELSWELYDQMLDEYFDLKEEASNVQPISNAPMSQAEMLVMYAQQFVEQEKRVERLELQSKKQDDLLQEANSNIVHMKEHLTKSPDSKVLQNAIIKYARRNSMQQSEAWSFVYSKVGDIYGVNLSQMVTNRHKKINEERVGAGKKPYAKSSLDKLYNKRKALEERGLMKEAMEIIAGL